MIGNRQVRLFLFGLLNNCMIEPLLRLSVVLEAIIWDSLLKSDAKSTTSIFRITVCQLQTMKVKCTVDVTQKTENISLQLVRVIIKNKLVSSFVLIKRKRRCGRLVYGNRSLIYIDFEVL